MISCYFGLGLILATARLSSCDCERANDFTQELKQCGSSGLTSLALSKDGDFALSCTEGGTIAIRDKDNRILASYDIHPFKDKFVVALAFDPNSYERVLFATPFGIFAWEWKGKAKPRELLAFERNGKKVFDAAIKDFAIAPNGRHIALIDANQRVIILDTDNRFAEVKAVSTSQDLPDPSFEPTTKHGTVRFSADSLTLAQTTGKEITLYDLKSRKELRRLKGHTDVVGSMCFVNQDTLLSGSYDNTCRLWTIPSGASRIVLNKDHLADCPLVAGARDGKRFVLAYGDEIAVFSFPDPKAIKQMRGPKSGLTGIAFLRDTRFLVTSGESPHFQFWDVDKGAEVKKQ